jgi:hypothetical protein
MNEQLIAELAYATLLRTGAPTGSREWQKIFAELIVKEAGKYLTSPEFIGRSDLDWAMVLNEHFGVEE